MANLEAPTNLKSLHRERLDAVVELKRQCDANKINFSEFEEQLHILNAKIEKVSDNFAVIDAKISQFHTELNNVKDEIFDTIESYITTETPRENTNNVLTLINDVTKRMDVIEKSLVDKSEPNKEPKKFLKIRPTA